MPASHGASRVVHDSPGWSPVTQWKYSRLQPTAAPLLYPKQRRLPSHRRSKAQYPPRAPSAMQRAVPSTTWHDAPSLQKSPRPPQSAPTESPGRHWVFASQPRPGSQRGEQPSVLRHTPYRAP